MKDTTLTSATGKHPGRNNPSGGFTLLELVVVIAIMGVLAAMTVATLSNDNSQRITHNEARRMLAFLQSVADDAVMYDRTFGISFGENAYELQQYDEQARKWQPVKDSREHAFPEMVRIKVEKQAGKDAFAGAALTRLPDIVFFSSGDTNHFKVTLQAEGQVAPRYVISADAQQGLVFEEQQK